MYLFSSTDTRTCTQVLALNGFTGLIVSNLFNR